VPGGAGGGMCKMYFSFSVHLKKKKKNIYILILILFCREPQVPPAPPGPLLIRLNLSEMLIQRRSVFDLLIKVFSHYRNMSYVTILN